MFAKLFTWWNGATLGALFDIKRRSELVGEDQFGNKYYQDRKTHRGVHRRYVVYKGLAEPSKVPPDWHGWLHYMFDAPPTEVPLPRQAWELEHIPNFTGTALAYRPEGSLERTGERRKQIGEYEAWSPDA